MHPRLQVDFFINQTVGKGMQKHWVPLKNNKENAVYLQSAVDNSNVKTQCTVRVFLHYCCQQLIASNQRFLYYSVTLPSVFALPTGVLIARSQRFF